MAGVDRITALKDEGNAKLKEDKLQEAIDKYSEAIAVYEGGSVFADSLVL